MISTGNGSDFQEFYSSNVLRTVSIVASVAEVTLVTPVILMIIWYERYRAGHVRTLINQLVTSSCWCGVVYNLFGQTPEVFLSLFGPFNETFCFVHIVVKNSILTQFIVIMTSISVVKYIYIFVVKNPSGKNDDFLCFFINLACAANAFLYQLVFHLLPGNNSHPYWYCQGKLPDPNKTRKVNYPISFLSALCPLVYIVVLFRIKLFKRKIDVFMISTALPDQRRQLPSTLGHIFGTSLADLATVAISLLTVIPTAAMAILIGTFSIDYLRSHQHLVYLHFHGLPSIVISMMPAIYFARNRKLRDFFAKELGQRLYKTTD